jgi:hypothetical protein
MHCDEMSVSVGELIRANGIQKGVRTVFTDKGRTRGRASRVCLVGVVCTTEASHRVIDGKGQRQKLQNESDL